jgi:O-acetyl-ADP-ribose deacetylase (regulator of RNase III)
METYKEVWGDLIELAKRGQFDVIGHGCNCFCTMGAGIAPQMADAFGCNKFPMEDKSTTGDINKLGQIDWKVLTIAVGNGDFDVMEHDLAVVNIYSQYKYGRNHADGDIRPLDYEALTLALRKMNHLFKGKRIGLPLIGGGLAGGDPIRIVKIIQTELKNCNVTLVKWSGPKNY